MANDFYHVYSLAPHAADLQRLASKLPQKLSEVFPVASVCFVGGVILFIFFVGIQPLFFSFNTQESLILWCYKSWQV